jgi:predicted N-formylglutamate amidohydrolase
MNVRLLVTCEHGGNRVPPRYRPLFRGFERALNTHLGYDPGALWMAREMAAEFGAPLVFSTVTRLLVDLNRSLGHPHLHGEPIRRLAPDVHRRILVDHYAPYRSRAYGLVRRAVGRGRRVVHISSHSFTPELNGDIRTADIGLLYDPARRGEARMCERWKAAIGQMAPQLKVRRNYPYAGRNDGLTSHFRRLYPAASYVGVELELNQAEVVGTGRFSNELRAIVIESLRDALVAEWLS